MPKNLAAKSKITVNQGTIETIIISEFHHKMSNCTYTDLLISSMLWMTEPRCTEDGISGKTNGRCDRFYHRELSL